QTHTQLITFHLGNKHIQRGNTFGNAHDQLDTTVGSLKDGVLAERRRNINYRCFSTSSFHGFLHSVEHRQTQVSLTAFTGSYTTNHFGAVSNGLFRVESTLRAGETLTNNLGIFVN